MGVLKKGADNVVYLYDWRPMQTASPADAAFSDRILRISETLQRIDTLMKKLKEEVAND